MKISKASSCLKFLSRLIPRRLLATQFSLKQSTLRIFEIVWSIGKHKNPIFRRKLISETHNPSGVACEWLFKEAAQKSKIVFFLHGGAYISGSLSKARNRAMRYPLHTNASLYAVSYRTSAVAPFPGALEDSVAAFIYLQKIAPSAKIIILGDSAGGGLALATAMRLRELNITMPCKIILNSPWADLTRTKESYAAMQKKDVVLQGEFLMKCAKLYAGNDLTNPYVSPVFGNYEGLPPIEIHVGTDEILLDDSLKVAENAKRDGVDVKIKQWYGMFHMFHYWEKFSYESRSVCEEIYDSIDEIDNNTV